MTLAEKIAKIDKKFGLTPNKIINFDYLNNINLSSIPRSQKWVGHILLEPTYAIKNVKIVFENFKEFKEPVIYVMNHTDRFNYWPFQFELWKKGVKRPYTTVWVKGKYYNHSILAKGLDLANLIPVPSIGYFIRKIHEINTGERLDQEGYKKLADGKDPSNPITEHLEDIRDYQEYLMKMVGYHSLDAFSKNLNVIIFPAGTRVKTLGKWHTGAAQLALYSGKTVIPVGCNGSDDVYPGNHPLNPNTGTITYKFGDPLSIDHKLKEFKISEPFELFSKSSQKRFGDNFQAATDMFRESVSTLLENRYK